MKENLLFYTALSSNDAIGSKRFEKILLECGSLERFFALSVERQMQCVGASERQRPFFVSMVDKGKEILRLCERESIEVIPFEDARFPASLRDIPDPPFLLYVKGRLLPHIPLAGVVGTRHATPEALEANRYFCREFVGFGVGVVSGLAQGHDEMAHRTALEHGGYTIAVLGTSFGQVAGHRKGLCEAICEHGAVVSEYHPMAVNQKWRFRQRNRLIAGLSQAVIIMQAPEKSGALITAEFAMRQQRPLFFLPGNPLNPAYKGSNALAKEGAIMATLPEDVIRVMYEKLPQKSMREKNESLPLLTEGESRFWNTLPQQFSLDALVEGGRHSIGEAITLLTQLEIKGYVVQYPGHIFEKRL